LERVLRLGVVGKDVSESDSPALHTYLMHGLGRECSFETVSIPPEAFPSRAEALFSRFDMFCVTIPFKREILPFLREIRGDAAVFGAVNTVLCRERIGYNTDGEGFMTMLDGIPLRGKRVLLLGVGGAGRSCMKKLYDGGAAVFGYDRDFSRAETAARETGCFTPLSVVPDAGFDIVVNCTGVGMHASVNETPLVRFWDGQRCIDGGFLSRCGLAIDLIYKPRESEFLRLAREAGVQTCNGFPMLFYQAYFADCICLGIPADRDTARALLEEYRKGNAL